MKVVHIGEEDWKMLVGLIMVPEMQPISRSLLIKTISELIELGKLKEIKLSLEFVCSQLWILTRYSDWETKDAILNCFSSEKLISTQNKVHQAQFNLVGANIEHESSFVRKAAIKFVSKLWKIQPNFSEKYQVPHAAIHSGLYAVM